MNKQTLTTIACYLILFTTADLSASANIERLKNTKATIDKKIARYASYLKKTQQKEQSVLSKIEQLSYSIRLKEDLINSTKRQIAHIERKINANKKKMSQFQSELKTLKEDYARMIVNSFKTINTRNKILFFLSAENFFQLYKRISYMQQYSASRRLKAQEVAQKKDNIAQVVLALENQQKNKETLINSFNEESAKLNETKETQKELYSKLRIDEKKYRLEIVKQEKQARQIDEQIQKLIEEVIRKAKEQKEEAKVASKIFEKNKGTHAWPVANGFISKRFGKQQHPVLKNIFVFCSGIEITTSKGSKAQSIFHGEVVSVQLLSNGKKTLYIRHGNYISVYSNLVSILVKQGDIVNTKQPVGTIAHNPQSKKTILKFLLYKDNIKLNPRQWINTEA